MTERLRHFRFFVGEYIVDDGRWSRLQELSRAEKKKRGHLCNLTNTLGLPTVSISKRALPMPTASGARDTTST